MRAALLSLALVACLPDDPPSTDAGADPDISACCNWYVFPLAYPRPQSCLDDHTAPGECRWLTCLGGLVEYQSCSPR